MAAGRQRWWRDYEQELAAWRLALPPDENLIWCRYEDSGLHVRLRLWTTTPVYHATFRVD